MNVYTTDKIRNVVILGHGGAGKTSLVESMAYLSGITSRLGNVAEGNTISDYAKEEIKRKFSISTSITPAVNMPRIAPPSKTNPVFIHYAPHRFVFVYYIRFL